MQPLSRNWSVIRVPWLPDAQAFCYSYLYYFAKAIVKAKKRLVFLHRHLSRFKWKFEWKNGKNFWLPNLKIRTIFAKRKHWKHWMYWLFISLRIFDCRVSCLSNLQSSRGFFCMECRSLENSCITLTKAKHPVESFRISEEISNTLTGFQLQFFRNKEIILWELTSESEHEFLVSKHWDFLVSRSSKISSTRKPKL